MKENTVVSELVWQFGAWCSRMPVQLECKWTALVYIRFILVQIMTSLVNMIKTRIVIHM